MKNVHISPRHQNYRDWALKPHCDGSRSTSSSLLQFCSELATLFPRMMKVKGLVPQPRLFGPRIGIAPGEECEEFYGVLLGSKAGIRGVWFQDRNSRSQDRNSRSVLGARDGVLPGSVAWVCCSGELHFQRCSVSGKLERF